MKQYLLFDLDGTLTDPKVGITTCVQYALKDFGIDEPDLDKLEPFIGPPLKDSFMKYYQMTDEQADRAVEKYRERFRDTGIFENELYGGIHDLLRTMKAAGMHMAVASSKPTVFVERILKHFKLDGYFEVVIGSELDGTRVEKAQVVQEALHKLFGEKPIAYDQVYMIGDRKYDILGARTFRIETIGVTYGYGSMEELKNAKADYIVQSVAELKALLMREVEELRRKAAENKSAQNPGKPGGNPSTKILWRMLLTFLIFFIVRMVASTLLSSLIQMISDQIPALSKYLIIQESDGIVVYNPNISVILQTLSYVAGVFFVWSRAVNAIEKTSNEMKLVHLKKESTKNYIILGIASVGATVGLSTLAAILTAMENAATEQTVEVAQYSPNFFVGLLCAAVVIPVIEEFVFRGIIYNCVRRVFKIPAAMLISGLIFSTFSGNGTGNQIYTFGIGCLVAYAYEYFGSFRVALAVRVGVCVVAYLMSVAGLEQTVFMSEPVCYIGLAVMAVGFLLLNKEKSLKTFKAF